MAVVFYYMKPNKICNKYPEELKAESQKGRYTHFHSGFFIIATVE